MSGFVKLYRRVLDNPVFKSDAEAMAFAWLILKASWQETEVRYKGQIVRLERGQLTVSARDMAKAMEWSKSRVSRFLNTLRERDMIEYVSGTYANVINIRNYGAFQSNSKIDGTPAGQPEGQERDRSGTQNNEEKELKERKNNITPKKSSVELPEWIEPEVWAGFVKMRRSIKKPLTDRASKNIITKLETMHGNGIDANAVLDNSTDNSWAGVWEPKGAGQDSGVVVGI